MDGIGILQNILDTLGKTIEGCAAFAGGQGGGLCYGGDELFRKPGVLSPTDPEV